MWEIKTLIDTIHAFHIHYICKYIICTLFLYTPNPRATMVDIEKITVTAVDWAST